MKTLYILLLLTVNSFASVPSVTVGEVIKASTINPLIQKHNDSVRYIVKVFRSGNSWYEVNNDGWVRQSGEIAVAYNQTTTVVSLLIKMKDAQYSVIPSLGSYVNNGTAQVSYQSLTVNNFQLFGDYNSSTGTINTRWIVEGYADQTALSNLGVIVSY